MITDIVQYLLQIAPSLAVVVFLVVTQDSRLSAMEKRILDMLGTCQQEIFDHLKKE